MFWCLNVYGNVHHKCYYRSVDLRFALYLVDLSNISRINAMYPYPYLNLGRSIKVPTVRQNMLRVQLESTLKDLSLNDEDLELLDKDQKILCLDIN